MVINYLRVRGMRDTFVILLNTGNILCVCKLVISKIMRNSPRFLRHLIIPIANYLNRQRRCDKSRILNKKTIPEE